MPNTDCASMRFPAFGHLADQRLRSRLEALRPKAVRIALSILGSADAAEDVAQEVMLRAHRSCGAVAPEAIEAWVRKTAVRCSLTALQARRPVELSVESACQDGEIDTRLAVEAALARLPHDQRALLALAVGQGWSYQEIADALEIPVGTVGSRLHAAKAAFRAVWEDE